MTRIVKIDPGETDHFKIRPVVEVLLKGGVAAGPTETFYGLMAAADQPEALKRIFTLKNRPLTKPLLLLLDQPLRVHAYGRDISPEAELLAEKFWPGPLTLLLIAQPGLSPLLTGSRGVVGVRVEGLGLVRTLVKALDRAVTGTSANRSGDPPACTAEQVKNYFGDGVDLIIDSGSCPGGKASNVIDTSLSPARLLRDGPLPLEALKAVVPDLRS
jgi:L-threonylcarbamoyladenylate synthase